MAWVSIGHPNCTFRTCNSMKRHPTNSMAEHPTGLGLQFHEKANPTNSGKSILHNQVCNSMERHPISSVEEHPT